MKFLASIVLSQLGLMAFAAPTTPSSPSYKEFTITSNFETDTAGTPVAITSSINVYNLLYYQSFDLGTVTSLDNVVGIVPYTPPNIAAYEITTQTQGPPSLTVVYETSPYPFFTLSSFYYGCALATKVSVAGVPVQCTITITGYNTTGAQVATQSFSFNPAVGQVEAQMLKANVSPDFSKVQRVTFATTSTADLTGGALVATGTDQFVYTVYEPSS